MKIELSKELKKGIQLRSIKTIDMVIFLIGKGFNTELDINKTPLSKLSYKGQFIRSANFETNNIILKF